MARGSASDCEGLQNWNGFCRRLDSSVKKLPIAIICVTCLPSAAYADRIPKEILGEWCGSSGTETASDVAYYSPVSCRDTDQWLVIKPDRYEGHEMGCRFVSVRTWYDRKLFGKGLNEDLCQFRSAANFCTKS
jgi:hypothetical protein